MTTIEAIANWLGAGKGKSYTVPTTTIQHIGTTASGRSYIQMRYLNSDTIAFEIEGRSAGAARYDQKGRRYIRSGVEFLSRDTMLRAFEAAN